MAIHTIGYDSHGNVGDYSTIAAFLADLGTNVISGDTAHVMYADPEKSPYWRESFGRVNANHFNIDVLYDSVCFFHPGGVEFYAVRDDLGGETITVKNIRLIGGGALLENYGLTNGTLIAENCISIVSNSHAFYGRVSSNLMICRNCLVVSPTYSGFYTTAANRCTVIDGASRGFRYGSADHCLSICYGANVCFESVSPKLYCVSNDATAGASNGCISNYDYSTLKMQIDNNIRNPFDFRLRPDSDLIGVGGTIDSDVPLDIDGQTRTTPDTPGFSIGVYLEESVDPGESNVLKSTAYKINGVDKVGTFDEAARNTDPGVANVLAPTAYKIQNVDKVGTFDESARNTDPGETNVKQGTTYKILNVDKTGTYNPLGNPPALSVSAANDGNGTSATITFTATSGATVEVYLKVSGSWVLQDTQVATGGAQTSTVTTPKGLAYLKVTAENAGGINAECVSVFVEDTFAVTAYYRVIGIEQMPSADYKRVILERVDAPINPNVS